MKGGKVFRWALIIALGGFLFGFDTAVISGAEQSIQHYFQLSAWQHGLTISIALIGTVAGALLGGWPSDRFGRKTTLLGIAVIYLISSLGTALATGWLPFMVFRFLGGFGVGASSVAAPIYISEIAPRQQRGRLVGMFQFNVVFGIVVSYLSNYLLGRTGPDAWRWMLGIQAIPSALFFLLLHFVPESPRWLLLRRNRAAEAQRIFELIDPLTVSEQMSAVQHAGEEKPVAGEGEALFERKYRLPVILAFLFAFFNQVSGINAIIYYAPRVFEMSGMAGSSSMLSTVGIGVINFCCTLLAMSLIDRIGRRSLMLIGTAGVILSLAGVSWAFYHPPIGGLTVPFLLFIFVGFFALSQGAVIWVFISEIFPNSVRAKGQTLGSATHWIMAAIIAFLFPVLAEKVGGGSTFLFFCLMMCLQLLFVWRIMPETKGKSLEQIETIVLAH